MPYVSRWEPAKLHLKYKGVRLYCVYEDDEVDHIMFGFFSLNPNNSCSDNDLIDAWDLKAAATLVEDKSRTSLVTVEDVLKLAIDTGEIKPI